MSRWKPSCAPQPQRPFGNLSIQSRSVTKIDVPVTRHDGGATKRVRYRFDPVTRQLAFVSALWIALWTALVCALLPMGLPLTKTVGSAFNPSTNIVVLRARAEHIPEPANRVSKGDPVPPVDLMPSPGAIVPFYMAVVQMPVAVKPAHIAWPEFSPPAASNAAAGLPYPRGPPTS